MQAVSEAVRFDLARADDDAELRALLRETSMGGAIEVAFLREPSYFHATAIQGAFTQVVVGRAGGRIAAVGTRAIRPAHVNGRVVDAGYLGDLRVRPEFRGGTTLWRGYRHLRELHADGRASVYTTVIVADNHRALETVAANRAGLPRYTNLGRVLTPMIWLKRRKPAIDADIVRGSVEMLPDIVAKLNENRLQFAPAYTEGDFLDGRFRAFRASDFYVLRRGGRIAGILGAWDQGSFRQTVVTRYNGWLARLRPVINLFRRPPLPPAGERLRFFYAAFISTDDDAAFAALLRRVYNDHVGSPYSHFVAGLHERDVRARAFDDYAKTPFAGRAFAVTFDGRRPPLDSRVPYIEAALL